MPEIEVMNVQNTNCGEADGSFDLHLRPFGGQAPYTFSINGETKAGPVFNGLSGGIYEVSSTDANGCSATSSIEIIETDGPLLDVEILSGCGVTNALININATQGQAHML